MALTLENEFVVVAPVEQVWRMLLDLERVASCLPGASVEPGEQEGELLGKMRVKLGPVTIDYRGRAQLEHVDEETRTAVVVVEGKETRGQGSASAKIRSSLIDEGGSTRVRVETELNITGRPAQFGRGIMQDVAAKMLTDFAQCLSKTLAEGEPAATLTEQTEEPAHLNLTPLVRGVVAGRMLKVLGLAASAAFLAKLVRRR
jgi:uncharacterized protein